jgi:hypothetical protein
LRRGDLDILVDAKDVRELQSQKPDVVSGSEIQDVLSGRAGSIRDLRAMAGHIENVVLLHKICNFRKKPLVFLASAERNRQFDRSNVQFLHDLPYIHQRRSQ